MGRLPRLHMPGFPVHVIQRGNDRGDIFRDPSDFRRFFDLLASAASRFQLAIHAYVLMTNHYHLLATPASKALLGRMMQSLGIKYVQYFNDKYSRSGTLWEGRYKSTVVDSEAYFLACSRYIELNPVRAGISRNPGDYFWSSYRANTTNTGRVILSPHEVYLRLGATEADRRAAYAALFKKELQAGVISEIRDRTQKSWLLGRADLGAQVLAKTGRKPFPTAHGRKVGWRKAKPLARVSLPQPPALIGDE